MVSPTIVTHLEGHRRVSVHRWLAPPGVPQRMPVVHDHATVALFLSGRSRFWMDGVYTIEAGDVLLVPAGSPHYTVETEGSLALGASLCLSCAPPHARDVLEELFGDVIRGGCAVRRPDEDGAREIGRVLEALERELDTPGRAPDLALDALISTLTVAVLRAGASEREDEGKLSSPLVADALAFIDAQACTGISLRDVAAQVARSPSHVAARIKEETGETAVGWITRARMRRGRHLLAATDENVETIALRCGFASASHFHRVFRKAHGISPGAWRRTHRP